ncbi:FAD-binding protein [Citrus sinensis]|uniref:FAD-binding protein n=1 Tax=Citrus sinensis TaxID=2711 RepID=A0ACB8J4G4_CITSI|nr:FAD-binding protein [Citrus sinensis]
MGSDVGKLKSELKEKVLKLFKDFMTRLAKLEELGTSGSKLLTGFKQGLEFLRRPPIDRTSELIENIVKSNETKRVKSYFESGCLNVHDSVQNMSKSKSILKELECLLEDVSSAIQTATECLPPAWDNDFSNGLDLQATNDEEDIKSSDLQEPEMTEIAAMMGIIYSMLKKDYAMQLTIIITLLQEKIVISLNLKSLSVELESYCLMWSLHPFINDEIMHRAWRLIP